MAPIFLPGSFKSISGTVQPASTCNYDDRVLVIVYLAGANDIINTAVPLNHFDEYNDIRSEIALPDNLVPGVGVIRLNDSVHPDLRLGLHPKNLYDNDQLAIIQRTAYPNPNRSHFASEDIMLKGIDGVLSTGPSEKEGWIGRFLMDKHPTYKGLPFGNYLDPLGIILGDTPDTGFHTQYQHDVEINLSGLDPSNFSNVLAGLSGQPYGQTPQTDHGNMLDHLIAVEKSTQVYSGRIQELYNLGGNSQDYDYSNQATNTSSYPWQGLPDQLKTIAKFISGGSTTKVYMARIGGWDTHNDQNNKHASLTAELGFSLEKFQKDLDVLGHSDRVMTVVFSEFGRKLIERGNGTDHGTLSSMFVIGNHINDGHSEGTGDDAYIVDQGIFGRNIDLHDRLPGDNVNSSQGGAANPEQRQHDYRSVFSSILKDWLGASNPSIQEAFPSTPESPFNYSHIPIIKPSVAVDISCSYVSIPAAEIQLNLKVFLEGYYDAASGLMTTHLVSQGLLPNEQPFDNNYFNYYGTETVSSFGSDIVDWLYLEAYDANGLLKKRQVALLRNDGKAVNLDGSFPLTISDIYPEVHRIAIHHQSHLGVMIDQDINVVDGATYILDTTQSTSSVVGNQQLKLMDQSVYGLIAGDLDQNGIVNTEDMGIWKRNQYVPGYQSGDLNADGNADIDDYSLWKNNRSKIGSPILHKNLKK